MAQKNSSQAQADAMARRMGFPDAATFLAYKQKEQQRITSPAPTGTPETGGGIHSVKDLIDTAMAIHPAWLFSKIGEALDKASGGNGN